MLEVKPDSPSHAISIIEADVMVDFAPSEDQLKKGTYSTPFFFKGLPDGRAAID